ncbi:TPA: S-methyl-5'-thioadenosine phosphorylase [Candidatus Poribacteria bacterium]|nr:S-methyl-5'-thioadenosine phosphorylase [Candidatus Poribacteria bacterium]
MSVKIGIIGGSGFYQMEGLTNLEEIEVDTPFGKPSGLIALGTLEGKRVAFLPRHGKGHRIIPSELNVRANIYALKSLGVEWVISVNAVGSLKEEIAPRDFVIPDQIVDWSKNRIDTFFGGGLAVHISMAEPFCPVLSEILYDGAKAAGTTVHKGGTYICVQGPHFSTKAESNLYRSLGFDVIGMTAGTEAKLAREAELCYASLSCSTDYDCWHAEHDDVTAEIILANLFANVDVAKKSIGEVVRRIPDKREGCNCSNALEKAFATNFDLIPKETKEKLSLIIGKYINKR